MEKIMKTLNVTVNRNADARMMMMALINHSLSEKMGCDDIVSEIMSDVSVELSDEELKFIAKRMISAINKYHDIKGSLTNKNQRYEKLMTLVESETGKETGVMTMIYSDISESYDVSGLSTAELSEVCSWLAAKAVLMRLPETCQTLAAASSYKKRSRVGKKVDDETTAIVVVEQTVENTQQTETVVQQSAITPEDVTVELLTTVFSEENIRKAVHQIMDKGYVVLGNKPEEPVTKEEGSTNVIVPARWLKSVKCVNM